jgi:hypothetical protein
MLKFLNYNFSFKTQHGAKVIKLFTAASYEFS